MRMIEKGAHIRICESKRRREPIAVLVPYGWYLLATGFLVPPEQEGKRYFRYSKEFYDFARTRRAALKITPEEARNHLLSHDQADLEISQDGPGDHATGHEPE